MAAGLVAGLHVFGGWPSWILHLNAYRLDLDVYRIGAQRWLHGWPLHDLFPVTRVGPPLPFTYPPVAAVLFSPLVVLPLGVDSALITLVSVVLVGVAIWAVLQAQDYPHRWWWVVAAMPVALLLEPVAKTLQLGQINLLLLTAMLADSLVKRALWPRGLLTGLAAAVKLTPLVGLLFFFLRGDHKAVRNGVLSFACATGARGRCGPQGAVRQAAGLALVLVAIAGVVASPMSWSHHWVWCVPALLILADLGRRHWMPRWLAITGVLLFLVPPQGLLPHGAGAEHGWALWQQIAGAGYVWWALLLLCAAAAAPDQWSTPARDSEPARSTGMTLS